jgi:hypothetical protein
VPTLPPYLIKPIFEQFCALLTERKTNHPRCHKPRIPDRVVFEKLVGVGQSEGSGLLLAHRHIRNVSQKSGKIGDVSMMAS